MTETPDAALLEQFVRHGSEAAFAGIVDRHIALVHSVALRHTSNPAQAQDITQAVFIILARKAAGLGRQTVLPGWLYHTARLTAANWQRAEARRIRREQEAFMQTALDESAPDHALWLELSPLLDDAMGRLGKSDRDALVLRYFQNRSLTEVGAALGIEERTAQKRLSRALEKLRKIFSKRGVALTAAAIAGAVSANSVQAAPVGLAKTISVVAVTKGAAATMATATLVKGALKVMAWTKAQTAIVVGVGILLAAGTATVGIRHIEASRTYPWQVPKADFETFYKSPPMVKIVPTKFGTDGGWSGDSTRGAMGIAQPIEAIVQVAYQYDKLHTVATAGLPGGRYDFMAKLVPPQFNRGGPTDEKWAEKLQDEIKRQFGVVGREEMRDMDVLVLKPDRSGVRGFKVSHSMPQGIALANIPGGVACYEQPIRTLILALEQRYKVLLVDQTGLNDNYDYMLMWPEPDKQLRDLEQLKQALASQLGLALVATNMPVKMLVVERAK